MSATRILIGPFRRRVFSDGLRALLAEDPGYAVEELENEAAIPRHLAADTPTVLILERRAGESEEVFLPESPAVAVILVSQEGTDVQIALRQLDPARLRTAIALAEGASHPRLITLSAESPAQPPFMIPHFRHRGQSAIAPIIQWLDTVFARELDHLDGTPGVGEAASRLRIGIAGETRLDADTEAERFAEMADAPLWQQQAFRTLGLDPIELRLICLAAAPDLDQRYGQAIGLLQNDFAASRPSASLLARLLDRDLIGADVEAMLSSRRLFARLHLVRPVRDAADGRPQPGLAIAPALLEMMRGERRQKGAHWWLVRSALPAQTALSRQIAGLHHALPHPIMLISPETPDGAGEIVAAHVAAERPVLWANSGGVSDLSAEASRNRLIDLALRARMHDATLIVDWPGAASDESTSILEVSDLGGLTPGLVVLGGHGGSQDAGEAIPLEIPRPDVGLRTERWQAAAQQHGLTIGIEDALSLAARLRFTLADTDAVARLAAGRRRAGTKASDLEHLTEAARLVSLRHAPRTVRRPPCLYGWSDIVLPAAIEAQVRAVPRHVLDGPTVLDKWGYAARLSYGKGVGALFSGPSGTGKTMSAQIIARALGVDLMQVELSRCVSKYIGETEKNIDACFVAAESASAVLLFDEADALFGKRTEIKDAHDRHANVEVAYLLQRIEAFEGLVILTTNFKANIDAAFLRRLRFVIDFPKPNAEERAAIWARAIPKAAPCAADLDVSFLARRLELSGGSIQQIAVNAAFAAAGDGGEIAMRHVMAATRAELLKMGMLSAERNLPDPPGAAKGTPLIEERAI